MSFDKLSKPELIRAADAFGSTSTGTKADIIAELEADGVSWELYQSLLAEPDSEEPAPAAEPEAPVVVEVDDSEKVILAWRGSGGFTNKYGDWNRKSPYVLVPKSVANALSDEMPRHFEIANEREVEQFFN